MDSRLAGAIVFVASGAVLVLEILAGRLLAPYVGVSLETFTGIIGVVLAGIAVGTWSGGRLADRVDPRLLLPGALALGGAAAIAAIPIIRALGPEARPPDPPTIVFLAATAFFAPSALLSAASPVVVKIQLADLDQTGRVVGRLSALGTAGSLVGVFTTGFVLVAEFPTTPVVITLGAVLVVLGIVLWLYLGRLRPVRFVVTGALIAAVASGVAVAAPRPCDVETAYFCASVRVDPDRPSGRTLVLDDLRHAYVDLDDPTYLDFAYTEILGDVVDAARPTGEPIDALHLGGGGFTLPRYVAATRPGSRNVVLELDPGVVRVAEDELGLVLSDDLRVVTGDARIGLRDVADDSMDLVVGDAFGGRAVPWHLTTVDFVRDIRRVLRDDGLYAQNIIDQPPLAFLLADVATLRDVFEHVAVIGPPGRFDRSTGGNTIVVASDEPLPAAAIAALDAARGGGNVVASDPTTIRELTAGARVLTDEHAPVDQLLT
ncbi:MAG: fused MFS/spermidine synthase [Ilumatobacteraceae bacterium]